MWRALERSVAGWEREKVRKEVEYRRYEAYEYLAEILMASEVFDDTSDSRRWIRGLGRG